jgi:hypothetical protein
MKLIPRIRRSASVGQPELRAALEALNLAERAKSPAKRSRALAALSAARDGLRAASQDRWFGELNAGSGRNWSNARIREMSDRLRIAQSQLEESA